MPDFFSTKTYDHNEGLSCCFRQWRATHSHCSLLHGYALKFHIVFGCGALDDKNWVQDFGGLKNFKEWLHHMFDHTILVAQDDPYLIDLEQLALKGLAEIRVVPAVGCEQTAKLVFDWLHRHLENDPTNKLPKDVSGLGIHRKWVESVEVCEHSGNSAIYRRH